jgi:hypothetical protein
VGTKTLLNSDHLIVPSRSDSAVFATKLASVRHSPRH